MHINVSGQAIGTEIISSNVLLLLLSEKYGVGLKQGPLGHKKRDTIWCLFIMLFIHMA